MGHAILPSTASSMIAQHDGFISAWLCISVLYVLTDYSEHVHCTVRVFVIVSQCQCVLQPLQKENTIVFPPPPSGGRYHIPFVFASKWEPKDLTPSHLTRQVCHRVINKRAEMQIAVTFGL